MAITFEASQTGRSLGLEWELQLLDAETLDLVDGIVPLLETMPDTRGIKPEFIQNTVEIITDPCNDIARLERNAAKVLDRLQASCADLGIRLAAAGTHPFGTALAVLTPLPRYLEMEELMGLGAHTQITFAQHLHIGMHSGEEAIEVANHLSAYLPVLVAVAANSPFWRGYETGFRSYRRRILAGARSYGIPPRFADWNAFSSFFQGTLDAGIYQTINDIHWDIRPRPHLGTVEIRATDAQSTTTETIDLAAFTYALTEFILADLEESGGAHLVDPPHAWIERENAFQSARLGADAQYVGGAMTSNRPLRGLIEETFAQVLPTAARLGIAGHVERLARRVATATTGAQRQLASFRETGSLDTVTGKLVEELAATRGAALAAPAP